MNLKLFFKSEFIEFYCEPKYFGIIPKPVPAYKMMPDWFKKISPTIDTHRDAFGAKVFTAKKCLPLVDAMSLGFIISTFGDVNIRTNKTGALIDAPVNSSTHDPVAQFHDIAQLGGKTSPTYPGPAVKFINKWVIKTAPGYSTLFIPPLNHIEPRFTCLSGLVDTDRYPKEVNFPAIWHLKDYDDIIPAGTPLVTCIPIKRSDAERKASVRVMSEKEASDVEKIHKSQLNRRSYYSKELREPRS